MYEFEPASLPVLKAASSRFAVQPRRRSWLQ